MHSTFRQLAVRLTRDMGLRFCGVDLMVTGSISEPCEDYCVLEINAAPGLDHYADIGKKQKGVVDDLYLKVLQAMKDLS
jgi:D-alanine-D-alanine ligase-like ATP-grasp enzyme